MPASDKPMVLVTEGGDPDTIAWMRTQLDVIEMPTTDPAFPATLARAHGLSVRTYTKVTAKFLDGAPNLKVVGRGGVGLESIDVAECKRRGIQVVYTPDANTLAVGDFLFGDVLQLLRPWNYFRDRAYTSDEFKKVRSTARGRQLNEMTIGIVGMGRVGRRVGHIAANGYGMRVLYNDLLDIPPDALPFKAERVDKPTLYRHSDIVSLHVTMLPGNENMVGKNEIATMKPDAILVNTSRGEVLDAHALAASLRSGHLAGACIDVYHPEPPPADFPLLGLPNVLLTPHMASRTATAQRNMSWVVRDIVAVLQGRAPSFPAP